MILLKFKFIENFNLIKIKFEPGFGTSDVPLPVQIYPLKGEEY